MLKIRDRLPRLWRLLGCWVVMLAGMIYWSAPSAATQGNEGRPDMESIQLIWGGEAKTKAKAAEILFMMKSGLGLVDVDMHGVQSDAQWKAMHAKGGEPAVLSVHPGVSADELMRALNDLASKGGFRSVQIVMERPTLADFRQIKQGMSLPQIYQLVGRPIQDVGSGLYILIYTLDDGSSISLTYGLQQITIEHIRSDGTSEKLEVK